MPVAVQISVVIICFNEERNIARCIDSVYGIADEILIVDSYSTDRTREICLQKGARLIEHPFEGHIEQKNYALSHAIYPYVLSLDADEALSEELAASVQAVKRNWTKDAYTMNRLSSYAGKWIRHCGWYPDRKIRLWDIRKGKWGGYNPHDKLVMSEGSTLGYLPGDILHHAYQNAAELVTKIQKYSSIYASTNRFKKKSSPVKIAYKSVFAFFRNYILQAGFLDGYEGFVISVSNANGVFYKYTKLYEINQMLTVSLIITTYNRKQALELVLLSVLNQTHMPDEVIIADDGSTPDTAQLIRSYAKKFPVPLLHCWHEDKGFRLAEIRNKAIAMAKSEYIIMVDGDMVLSSNFVKSHKKAAAKGHFLQGSRVLLSEKVTRRSIENKRIDFWPFQQGITNRFNAMHMPILSRFFSVHQDKFSLKGIRGCNMAFWKEDAMKVNGFNENFVGWGREDSEFAVRLFNNNIRRRNLKFGGVAYHLYHPEHTRECLAVNQMLLQKSIDEHVKFCDKGVNQHVLQPEKVSVNE
jgi:glycosyltransferase involved in cell wall biosynthesis